MEDNEFLVGMIDRTTDSDLIEILASFGGANIVIEGLRDDVKERKSTHKYISNQLQMLEGGTEFREIIIDRLLKLGL